MKSRLAMMAMLVVGLLMSGTGAGLAVSGVSGDDDASVAQYGVAQQVVPCDRNGDGVVDATEDLNGAAPGCERNDQGILPAVSTPTAPAGAPVPAPASEPDDQPSAVQGEEAESAPAPDDEPTPAAEPQVTREQAAAQPAEQVAASGRAELPFTGFAAVPILLGGIALLAGGLVLRRRTTA